MKANASESAPRRITRSLARGMLEPRTHYVYSKQEIHLRFTYSIFFDAARTRANDVTSTADSLLGEVS